MSEEKKIVDRKDRTKPGSLEPVDEIERQPVVIFDVDQLGSHQT